MEGRKFEDLNMDCMINVLERVGMESLLLDVPFVCKSWYKATLNPKCWEQLIFPKMTIHPYESPFVSRLKKEFKVEGHFPITAFIKSIVKRSNGSASTIDLPGCCDEEVLISVADDCPGLKNLSFQSDRVSVSTMIQITSKISSLVSKWKHLEMLTLGTSSDLTEILTQIGLHCNKFVSLRVNKAYIGNDEASAIVTYVSNVKHLFLRSAIIERENLVTILQGCKELVELDVRDCVGFEGDEEIIKLASHITEFMYEGSRTIDPEDNKESRDDDRFYNYDSDDYNYNHYNEDHVRYNSDSDDPYNNELSYGDYLALSG